MRLLTLPILAVASVLAPSGASAQEARTTGVVTLEPRLFFDSPPFAQQRRHAFSGVLEVEHKWRSAGNAFNVRPHLRVNSADRTGNYIDLREALWERDFGKLSVRAGFQKVFWGVMESNHLIDIVNQTDLASDPDGEEKFGQPIVALGWRANDLGRVELLYLPYFRERLFPGRKARLRADPPVEQRDTLWKGGRWHPDAIVRWSNSLEVADIGVYVFRGLSREPDLTLDAADGREPVLQARYRPITQIGADFQVPQGSMMWKGELLYRRGHGRPFSAFALGGEYTMPIQAGDLGFIFEWSRDYRDASAPFTNFSKALFGALRLHLSDQHDSEIIVGQQYDRTNKLHFFSVEMSRRLGDTWKIHVEGKKFITGNATTYPFKALRVESYLQLKISHFF